MLALTIIILIFNSCTNVVSYDYEDTLCVTEHRQTSLNGKYVHYYYSSSIPGDIYRCSSCGSNGIYIYPLEIELSGDPYEVYHWVFGSTISSSYINSICTEYHVSGSQYFMYDDLINDCEYSWATTNGSDWFVDWITIDPCPDTTTTTSSTSSNTGLIIGIVVAVIGVIIVGVVAYCCCCKSDAKKNQKTEPVNAASTHGEQVQMIHTTQKPTAYAQQMKQVPIVAAPHTEQIPMIRSEYKSTPIYKQQVKQVPVAAPMIHSKPAPIYKYEAVKTTVSPPAYAEGAKNVAIECDKNYEIKQWFYSQVNLPEDNDRYFDMFIQNGFDDLDIIKQMTETDLFGIGITKLGHQRKILNAISKL